MLRFDKNIVTFLFSDGEIILFIALIFLSTYNPKELQILSQKKNVFFGVKKIEIKNVYLINKKEIFFT